MMVANSSRVMARQPLSQRTRCPGSVGASSKTSSKVMASGGRLPRSSMTTTFSIVGHSARIDSILAACWAFSTTISLAPTLLMMNAAWFASELG